MNLSALKPVLLIENKSAHNTVPEMGIKPEEFCTKNVCIQYNPKEV